MLYSPRGTLERLSPALGLYIVHVGVLPHLDGRNGAADVHAVLDHGVAVLQLSDRELVADGDIVLRADLDVFVLVHDPADQLLPCLHALDDDHSDGVVFVVHYEMNHGVRQRQRRLPAFGSTGRVQSWMLILRVGSGSAARTAVLPSGPSRYYCSPSASITPTLTVLPRRSPPPTPTSASPLPPPPPPSSPPS